MIDREALRNLLTHVFASAQSDRLDEISARLDAKEGRNRNVNAVLEHVNSKLRKVQS